MALLKSTDRFYHNAASGAIYDLATGQVLDWNTFSSLRNSTGGTVLDVSNDAQLSAAVAEYANLHPATPATVNAISTSQAREAVRQRYLHYLQREPTEPPKVNVVSDPNGWDFWTSALINDANAHGLDAALADLNMAFVASEEYKKLQAAASTSTGNNIPGGTTIGDGTAGTTTAAGEESIITKGINFVKEHYIIAGLIVVVGGMSLFGGDSSR